MSGFTKEAEQKKLHEHDIKISSTETIEVPILKEENFGEDMAIDDKNIGGESYTIITNRISGKIAFMIRSIKTSIICQALEKISVKTLFGVKTFTKDLANNYDWVVRTKFMGAKRIADKFHVLKLGFEALQAVRIRYRQKALEKERQRREIHKEIQAQLRDQAKRENKKYQTQPLPPPKKYSNDETACELLARSRFLLFKHKKDWTTSQSERAKILFAEYPEIKKAYDLIIEFRKFYELEPKKYAPKIYKEALHEWKRNVGAIDISEIQNFVSTVDHHEPEILNYFDEGYTNAFAESMNSKIQRFIISNYGIRNRDFFHFRIAKLFS